MCKAPIPVQLHPVPAKSARRETAFTFTVEFELKNKQTKDTKIQKYQCGFEWRLVQLQQAGRPHISQIQITNRKILRKLNLTNTKIHM